MVSCCAHAKAAERLFSHFAKAYRWRYQLLGLARSQRQLAAGLEQAGLQQARLLEIGCGVGCLHQQLLERGARRVIGVDLSARLLAEAQAMARRRGLEERVRYVQGDFLDLAGTIEAVDLVILDKVICCYPDAQALLTCAAEHALRALALTYPRLTPLNRFGVEIVNHLLALGGSDFRTYLHAPQAVGAWLGQAGMVKAFKAETWVWLTEMFVRP